MNTVEVGTLRAMTALATLALVACGGATIHYTNGVALRTLAALALTLG